MAAEKIFINPEEVKNSAESISRFNETIREKLAEITGFVETVDWEALGEEAMQESFSNLKPEFDKFYDYVTKVINFLKQNVAEDAVLLDEVISGNASELKSR